MFDTLMQDVSYAARTLRRSTRFSVPATLTLALGIGANTGLFSILYGVLFRPLPYQNAASLALIEAERDYEGTRRPVRAYFSLAELDTWAQRPSFDSLAFYATDVGALSNGSRTEAVDFATVSASFFATLQGPFRLGRPLGPADDLTPSIVISERLWRRLFGGSADVIGQRVLLNSQRGDGGQRATWRRTPFTIIGVADAAFQFPSPHTDLWTPAGFVRTVVSRCCSFSPIARLRRGVSLDQANADARLVAAAMAATNARDYSGLRTRVAGLHQELVREVRPSLWVLFAAVGLVLLVACANVGNLLLARNASRAREVSVRLALGATRARLVRQSIVESALLTWIGLVLGIAVAVAMVETLHGLEPPGIPRLDAVRLDGPVLLFGCVAAALTTMIVGMLPPFHPVQAAEALRIGGSAATARSSGQRARRVLVTIEVALSVVLLVGAVLLGRSLYRLLQTDVGVVTDQVLTASLSLDLDRELSGVQQTALVNRILNQFQMVPGTAAVGVGTSLPPNASRLILTLSRTNSAGEPVSYRATAIASTPGYFSALRIPLLRGRLFTDADDTTHPPVVIMSAATARRFFGDGDPVGRTMSLPTLRDGVKGTVEATLVGIIGDVRYSGLDRVPDDAVYRPFAQQPWPSVYLVARTTGDPSLLLRSLTDYIAAVDRGISVSAVNTLDDVVAESAGQPRFRTVALAGLAGLALMLAAVGLYGVVGYSVSQRTCEMGIRMAIGATSTDIVRMIMSEGMRLAISGVAIGLGAGYVLARFLAGFLYGIASSDVASFALACLIPLLFALITTYIPARRATRIDPSVALRAE